MIRLATLQKLTEGPLAGKAPLAVTKKDGSYIVKDEVAPILKGSRVVIRFNPADQFCQVLTDADFDKLEG